MAVPEGVSIYDIQGTILYRVVGKDEHKLEMLGHSAIETDAQTDDQATTHAAASTTTTTSALVSGGFSMSARYGPLGSSIPAVKRPPRLTPLGTEGAAVANVAAAATGTTNGVGGGSLLPHNHLTAERALAQLFAPTSLQTATAASTDNTAAGGDFPEDTAAAGPSQQPRRPEGTAEEEAPWLKVAALDRTSRLDVVLLQQHLQRRCREEHARPRGVLCPIRERIFDDGFKEVVRQVTVLCPERGLLLEELSKGMAQSTETYDVLFDSACQYAVRKSIERDLRSYLFDEKKTLESEVRRLENHVNELRAKHEGMMRRFEEQMTASKKLHEEEIGYLKKANQQLISEIKRLAALESAMSS